MGAAVGESGKMHRSFVGSSPPKGGELRCLRMTTYDVERLWNPTLRKVREGWGKRRKARSTATSKASDKSVRPTRAFPTTTSIPAHTSWNFSGWYLLQAFDYVEVGEGADVAVDVGFGIGSDSYSADGVDSG
jgi:hypothetical protein